MRTTNNCSFIKVSLVWRKIMNFVKYLSIIRFWALRRTDSAFIIYSYEWNLTSRKFIILLIILHKDLKICFLNVPKFSKTVWMILSVQSKEQLIITIGTISSRNSAILLENVNISALLISWSKIAKSNMINIWFLCTYGNRQLESL